MNSPNELIDDRELWGGQTNFTCGDLYQIQADRSVQLQELARSGFLPKTGRTTTVDVNFSRTAEDAISQGVLAVGDFVIRVQELYEPMPGFVAVIPYEWPLKERRWNVQGLREQLNTLLWIDESKNQQRAPAKGSSNSLVYSHDALSFCLEHRLFGRLQLVVKLVHECFPSTINVSVDKECDPESEDEWLLLTAQIREEVESALNLYDDYTRRLIDTVPWPQRDKIRFNYDLI